MSAISDLVGKPKQGKYTAAPKRGGGGAIQALISSRPQSQPQVVSRPRGEQNPNYQRAKADAERMALEAEKAGSRKELAKQTAGETIRAMYTSVPRFAASIAEAPGIIARGGTTTQREYNVPIIGKVKSYQSEFENTANDIIDSKRPLSDAAKLMAEVVLAGMNTGGLASGAKNAAIGFSKAGAQKPILESATKKLAGKGIPQRVSSGQKVVPQTGNSQLKKTVQNTVSKKSTAPQSPSTSSYGPKNRGFVDTVKSSPMSDAAVKRAVSGTYTPRETEALVRKVNQAIKTDINKAKDVALSGTNDESVATAMELIKHYQNKGDFDSAVQIADDVAVKLTEAGRSVQAASVYNRLTPEGVLRYAQRELNAANKANPKLKLKLTGEQGKELTDLAKKAQEATGEAKAIATQRMLDRVQELIPTPKMEQAMTLWKAGLLTNPSTQVANLTGNTSMLALENLKDIPATFFDKILPGARTKALPNLGAQAQGVGEGVRKAGQYIKTGIDPDDVLSKVDYKKANLPPVLKQYSEAVFRTLGAGDKVFRQTLMKKTLAEAAKVDGLNKGLSGQALMQHIDDLYNNPTNEMIELAVKDARYGTFTGPNKLAEFVGRGKQALGPYRPVADFLMPFTRTPSNIAARIVDYSPLGFGRGAIQALTGSGKRNVVESLGRATVGTGIAGAGYGLAQAGQMTGTMPTNQTERNLWELQGKQPNSVRVGDKWLNLDKISPVGNILGSGANAQASGNFTEAGLQTIKGLKDMTFLKGMSSALDAIGDPKRYGESFIENSAGSVVPSVVAAAARQMDKNKREVSGSKEAFMNRIPGLKDNLLPKRDALGNETFYEGNQFVSPFRPTSAKDNPVVNEIERLRALGADIALTKPDSTISIKGAQIELTPEELDLLRKDSGGLIQKTLQDIISKPAYQNADPVDQVKVIKDVISKSREVTGYKTVGKERLTDELRAYIQNKQTNPFYKP